MIYNDYILVTETKNLRSNDMNKSILCSGDTSYTVYIPWETETPIGSLLNFVVISKGINIHLDVHNHHLLYLDIGVDSGRYSLTILFTKEGWIQIADVVNSRNGYVYGGSQGVGSYMYDCDQYNSNIDIWTSKMDGGAGASNLAASTIFDKGYKYGGFGGWGTPYSFNICYEYTPKTNSWTSKTQFPAPNRHNLSAMTIDNKGYIIAGYNSDTSMHLQDCDEFDAEANTWVSITDTPSPAREGATAPSSGWGGHIIGGTNGGYLYDCDQLYNYSWIAKPNLPYPSRAFLASTNMNNRNYIFGGCGDDGGTGNVVLNDCDEFSGGYHWYSRASMPAPARGHLAASAIDGKSYIYGGTNTAGDEKYKDCDEYIHDTWTSKSDMPDPARSDLAASTI